MKSIRLRIKRRLKEYIKLDISGIRKLILKMLLKFKKVTVYLMWNKINKNFKISYNAVASTLGYIDSKIGILHSHKESYKTPTVYSLKEEYIDIIQKALSKEL